MHKVGRILVERGLLRQEQLDQAAEESRTTFKPLATVLAARRLVSEEVLLPILAEQYRVPFVTLREALIEPAAVRAVPAKLAVHYGVMPLRLKNGLLTLALGNPLDMSAVEDIEANLGFRVERVLAAKEDILAALRRHYGVGADTVEKILSDAERAGDEPEAVLEQPDDLAKLAEDASVVRLVNQILHEAISDRATDIHFEMQRDQLTVRRRIDGVLYDTSVPKNIRLLQGAIVSRIKLMSGLDIVERRLPQDGRARVKIGQSGYDLRVSVVPSVHGEDVVIRILPATMLFDLSRLGLSEDHRGQLEQSIAAPHGILFVTGPTGSGKSTTLYACLLRLNSRERKIITIEDPVEYELAGITQTQVNPKIGLTFALALRSMLRHDPDVMMVGEVRDKETAEIAIQTAMTGHLVLSTLHTNDAAGGSVRLMDMGIEPYLISSTVLAFVAQRLVRVLCPACKESRQEGGGAVWVKRGCRECNGSGFRGRVAISEILPLTREIQNLIVRRASSRDIREAADRAGMRTLAQDGKDKVLAGITTEEEVLRVTSM